MSKDFLTPAQFAASVAPSTITGFLIDVYKETAQVVTVDRQLESYYKILDCDIIGIVDHRVGAKTRSNPEAHVFAIICDDEALNKTPQKISAIDNMGSAMLCGNLFIVKRLLPDDSELASLTPDDIGYLKKYIHLQGTRKFPKPYPMLCQCEYLDGGDETC